MLFLSGIFINSNTFGFYALLATAVNTLTAIILGIDKNLWRARLFGFNGTLVSITFAFFLKPTGVLVIYTIVVVDLFVCFYGHSAECLKCLEGACFNGPFYLHCLVFSLPFFSFHVLNPAALITPGGVPAHIVDPGTVDNIPFLEGFFKEVGQIMFQDNLWAEVFLLVAALINSPISFGFISAGAFLALVTALVLGTAEPTAVTDLYGFNAVLTGIVLGGFFCVINWRCITLYLAWHSGYLYSFT